MLIFKQITCTHSERTIFNLIKINEMTSHLWWSSWWWYPEKKNKKHGLKRAKKFSNAVLLRAFSQIQVSNIGVKHKTIEFLVNSVNATILKAVHSHLQATVKSRMNECVLWICVCINASTFVSCLDRCKYEWMYVCKLYVSNMYVHVCMYVTCAYVMYVCIYAAHMYMFMDV